MVNIMDLVNWKWKIEMFILVNEKEVYNMDMEL